MSMPIASVFNLSPAEKLQLVQDLWDDLAAKTEDVPIPEWHMEELDRRGANYDANPDAVISWEESKRRIRAKYGR